MAKSKKKTVFFCKQCGYESSKWLGQCPGCHEWDSFVEEPVAKAVPGVSGTVSATKKDAVPTLLSNVTTDDENRISTKISEMDRVLGGGIVVGSLVLVGGDPGIGKSTLLLQMCRNLSDEGKKVLYVSGEESLRQIKMRAERLGTFSRDISILCETDLDIISNSITDMMPDVVIIDSIQTMYREDVGSAPGSVSQVREATSILMRIAKGLHITVFIVGHVTKEGVVAGPRVLEHMVDTVLYFEGDRHASYRLLRAVKNRFGSTNEIGVFEMMESGLQEVPNPSAMLLEGRPLNVSGTCVTCVMEGSRPILAEVQVLVTKSSLPSPRRTANGFDYNRLFIILAILEKRCGLFYGTLDVYLNVVGGFRLDEPSGDLAVALCLYSSLTDKSISEHVTAFGELGLGGEVRSISNLTQRILEAERMGFQTCIIPKQSMRGLQTSNFQIQLVGVRTLKEAFDFLEQPQA